MWAIHYNTHSGHFRDFKPVPERQPCREAPGPHRAPKGLEWHGNSVSGHFETSGRVFRGRFFRSVPILMCKVPPFCAVLPRRTNTGFPDLEVHHVSTSNLLFSRERIRTPADAQRTPTDT